MSSTTKVAEAFKIKTKAHFISKPNNVSSKTSPTKFVNGQAATTSSKLLSKPAEDSKNKKENLSASALIVTGGTDLTRSMKGTLSSTAMRSKSPNARLGSSALMNVKSMRIEQRPEEKDKKKSGYNAPATMSRNYKVHKHIENQLYSANFTIVLLRWREQLQSYSKSTVCT